MDSAIVKCCWVLFSIYNSKVYFDSLSTVGDRSLISKFYFQTPFLVVDQVQLWVVRGFKPFPMHNDDGLFFPKDVLSAALDAGVAISILVVFFTLEFPKNGSVSGLFLKFFSFLNPIRLEPVVLPSGGGKRLFEFVMEKDTAAWPFIQFRNTVHLSGADGLGTPVRPLAPGATFGWVRSWLIGMCFC